MRQADSHESLEFPILANHPIRANRANRFARITPLRVQFGNPQAIRAIRANLRIDSRDLGLLSSWILSSETGAAFLSSSETQEYHSNLSAPKSHNRNR